MRSGPGATAGELCEESGFTHVVDGRFKGGWTTRHYGQPDTGVHAVQLEVACRAYVDEPVDAPGTHNWPPPYDAGRAASLRATLERLLRACRQFAES